METKAIQKFEQQGLSLIDEASNIMIVDDITRELAAEFTNNTRKAVKTIEAEFRPDIESAHKLHKDLLNRLKKLIAPFKEAQGIVDGEIKRDWLERDRIRQEEERRVRVEAEAERKRQEEVLAADVENAIESGDMEGAEALSDIQVVVEPAIPVPETQRTTVSEAGSATIRRDIKVEVVDKMMAIKAVHEGILPDGLITIDLGAAKRYAKANKGSVAVVMPGFRITEDAVVSGRTR